MVPPGLVSWRCVLVMTGAMPCVFRRSVVSPSPAPDHGHYSEDMYGEDMIQRQIGAFPR